MTLIAVFAVIMAVSSKLMIPMPLVPFTLQPLVCMLCGMLLGSRRALASQLLYIAMGLVGLPVFTGGGGLGSVLSPTFGYLIGFAAGAWLIGFITERLAPDKILFAQYFLAALAGLAVVYVIGVAYLYVVLNYWTQGKAVGVLKVIEIGFLATILPDLVKAAIAAVVSKRLNKIEVFRKK